MSKQQYFLHATPESSSEKIKSDGFLYVKWRPTVTWSLRLAVFHATEQWYVEKPETKWELWNILCLELPDQKNIKTSVKWNIWVDYKKKEIHGKPNIWMWWKAQWAIYDKWIHHQGKKNIASREELERELISKDKIALELKRSSALDNFTIKFKTLLAEFKPVDLEKLKKDMLLAFKESIIYQKQGIELDVIVEDILFSTFQASCMEFVRSLFLGQAYINWYKMFKDKSNGKEKEWDMRNYDRYKLIRNFNKYLIDVNKEDFALFKWSPKYEILNRYLKSSLNYIDKKFPKKQET